MAIAEQEITRPLNIPLTQDQRERLEKAALTTDQSLEEFMVSALLHAADVVLVGPRPTPVASTADPLDRVAGIFKDEPLMEALMERIRKDRRRAIALFREAELREELADAETGK